jgi:hypothetical protein
MEDKISHVGLKDNLLLMERSRKTEHHKTLRPLDEFLKASFPVVKQQIEIDDSYAIYQRV